MKTKVALVTGANRGMGLASSRKLAELGYKVIMLGRNEAELKSEVNKLKDLHYLAEAFMCDVGDEKDIQRLISYISQKYESIDVLINNAGIYVEEGDIFSADEKVMRKTFETNTIGPFNLMKGLIPLMIKKGHGRVVNVSSGLGSFEGASGNCPSYCLSKVSLNMLTNLFAAEVQGTDVLVNSICPGWVKTDMGGPNATRTIEEGIYGIIWAATLEEDGPNGGFFRDGKPVDW
jgi:NAD(P)-dependent dehydrogenase (short-subunit alcohol dehydrogenase family)